MSTWLPSDKHGHRPGARVGLFDGRNDLRGILRLLHPVVLDAHCVQHRFDDFHSVFFGQARRNARLFAQQPHDHANRILSFHRYAAQRVHRVQQSRVLHHEHGSMAGGGKAAADGYAFVLFANLHHFEIRIAQDRLQQVVTRDAIGQSDDEANAGLLDFADDVLNPQRTFRHVSSSDVILITMKAMYSVTAVVNMIGRGGEQLWNTSHWTFTRSIPGHGSRIRKENDCTRVGWHTRMGRLRTLFIDGVKDLPWRWRPWETGTGWLMRSRLEEECHNWSTRGWRN